MKKHLRMYLGLLVTVVFISTALFANPQIQKKHAGMKKDNARVNCVYCHTGTGIEKKKGQNYLKGQGNYNKLKAVKKCAGSGCHI